MATTKRAMVNDALTNVTQQLEALLFRRKGLISGEKIPSSKHGMLPQCDDLDLSDVKPALKVIQAFIVNDSLTKADRAVTRMLDIGRKFDMEVSSGKKRKVKDKTPTSKDARETVDDFHDESVECFLLETLHMIFDALPDEGGNGKSGLKDVTEQVVEYAFDHLKFNFSPAIRHEATKCIGSLSRVYLKLICDLLLRKLSIVKKDDDARHYVTYQKAASDMHFSLVDESKAAVTMDYFTKLAGYISKVERGVLREAMASSLSLVLPRLAKEMTERDSPRYREFWTAFGSIYNTVGKWSKNKKHTSFCLDLLIKLNISGIKAFYDQGLELVKALLIALAAKDTRKAAMEGLLKLLEGTDETYIEQDQDKFSQNVAEMVKFLFGKKRIVVEDQHLVRMIVIVAQKHTPIAVRLIMDQLTTKEGDEKAKGPVINALAQLSQQFPEKIVENNFQFAPLICKIPEEGNVFSPTDTVLLAGALGCFPTVRPSNVQQLEAYVRRVGSFTLSHDRSVAQAALLGLQRFALLDPSANLRKVLGISMQTLLLPNLEQEEQLKAFQNFSELLNAYVDWLSGNEDSVPTEADEEEEEEESEDGPGIPTSWTGLRHMVEATVLCSSAHDEVWVRSEALRLLTIFNRPEIRVLERVNPSVHFLADVLLARCEDASSSIVDTMPVVLDVLKKEWSDYEKSIVMAWNVLAKSIDVQQFAQVIQDPSRLVSWENRLEFLCAGLRLGTLFPHQPKMDLVNRYFTVFVKMHLSQSGELVKFARDRFATLDSSCVDELVSRIRSAEIEICAKKHKPRPGEDYPREVYLRASFCNFLMRISSSIDTSYFSNSQSTNAVFSEAMDVWITTKEVKGLSLVVRGDIATTIEMVLELGGLRAVFTSAASTADGKERSGFVAKLFVVLRNLLPLSLQQEVTLFEQQSGKSVEIIGDCKQRRYVERAVFTCINALLRCGPIDEPELEKKFVAFLEESVLRGTYLRGHVVDCCTTFLELNPHHSYHFIVQSFSSYPSPLELTDKNVVGRFDGALVALEALAKNFCGNLERWLVLIDIPLASILMLVLMQLGHPERFGRKLAIQLANAISAYDKYPVTAATTLPSDTHSAPHIYALAAQLYSNEIAANYPELTRPLLHECLRLTDAAGLPVPVREHCLVMLLPWMRNIHLLVAETDETQAGAETTAILNELMGITHQQKSIGVLHGLLQEMWRGVVVGGGVEDERTLNAVVRHLISGAPELELSPRDVLVLSRIIAAFVARTQLGPSMILSLFAALRNYTEEVPAAVETALQWSESQVNREDFVGFVERQAFRLLSDAVFLHEQGETLAPFLPLMCMNAIVLFGPAYPEECPETMELIGALLHTLAVRLAPGPPSRATAMIFRDAHFPDPIANPKVYKEFREGPFPPVSVVRLCDMLSVHRPDLRAAWADLCLDWARQTPNTVLCKQCVEVFGVVALELDKRSCDILCQILYGGLRHARMSIVTVVLKVFVRLCDVPDSFSLDYRKEQEKMMTGVPVEAECVPVISSISGVCIHSSMLEHYDAGITLLRCLVNPYRNFSLTSVFGAMSVLWNRGGGTDSTLFAFCERGLSADTAATRQQSLWLVEAACAAYGTDAPDSPTGLLLLMCVSHAVQLLSGDPGQRERFLAALEKVESHASVLAPVKDVVEGYVAPAKPEDAETDENTWVTWLSSFADCMANLFQDPALVVLGIRHTAKMASRPAIAFYRRAYISLLSELVSRRRVQWGGPEYAAVSSVLCDLAYSYGEAVFGAAVRAIGVMTTMSGADPTAFSFLRHPPPRKLRAAMPVKDSTVAIELVADEEIEKGIPPLHHLIHRFTMGLSSTPPPLLPMQEHVSVRSQEEERVVDDESSARAETRSMVPQPSAVAPRAGEPTAMREVPTSNVSIPELPAFDSNQMTLPDLSGLADEMEEEEEGDGGIEISPLNVAEIEAELEAERSPITEVPPLLPALGDAPPWPLEQEYDLQTPREELPALVVPDEED